MLTPEDPFVSIQAERIRRLEEAAEGFKLTIRHMINDLLRRGRPSTSADEDRLDIFMASSLKACGGYDTLRGLASTLSVEEMSVLLRSFAELAINASFLQTSSNIDLKKYMQFDSIAAFTMMNDFLSVVDTPENVPPELFRRTKENALNAAQESGLKLQHRSVFERAKQVDVRIGGEAFRCFANSVYGHGHVYVHQGYSTLSWYRHQLRGTQTNAAQARLKQAGNLVFGAAQVLQVLCLFSTKFFAAGSEEEAERLTLKLNQANAYAGSA